uniref:Guanine nucleotide-binding protein subunit gamma n=1 Tax=Macrostomum lignano TaxID=282301 RepID=A0A1I8H6A1_9PLAT
MVEQLRQEAALERKPVSECVREMLQFVEKEKEGDCLVIGFAAKKDNPRAAAAPCFDLGLLAETGRGCQREAVNLMSKLADALAVQRCMVEQLRVEAGLNRLSVSQTVAELIKYCEDRSADDMLINGFTKQTENPFKEKGGCVAL